MPILTGRAGSTELVTSVDDSQRTSPPETHHDAVLHGRAAYLQRREQLRLSSPLWDFYSTSVPASGFCAGGEMKYAFCTRIIVLILLRNERTPPASSVPCFRALSSVDYTRARSEAARGREFNEVSMAPNVVKEKDELA